MIHFSFVPLKELTPAILNSLEERYELEEVVTFESVGELKIFIDLLDAKLVQTPFQNIQNVDSSWIINGVLKSFSEAEFELFYQKWIDLTGRDNTMDEYGQLICFNSAIDKLNKESHRVVLQNAI